MGNPQSLTFRIPMSIRESILFPGDLIFPICPRCDVSLEREYQNYCDRCGQALDWNKYDTVPIRYPKQKQR